jgi:hypothetical protein
LFHGVIEAHPPRGKSQRRRQRRTRQPASPATTCGVLPSPRRRSRVPIRSRDPTSFFLCLFPLVLRPPASNRRRPRPNGIRELFASDNSSISSTELRRSGVMPCPEDRSQVIWRRGMDLPVSSGNGSVRRTEPCRRGPCSQSTGDAVRETWVPPEASFEPQA